MIVYDFDLNRLAFRPTKADSISVVDADGILPVPVSAKLLQVVARRSAQIFNRVGER
jgi:hypothetical protein